MQNQATTVYAYLQSFPAEHREALDPVRSVILKNLASQSEVGKE